MAAKRALRSKSDVMTARVITRHAGRVLIEWLDSDLGVLRRSIFPETGLTLSADGRTAEVQNPDEGLAYGDPLEHIIGRVIINADELARELRRNGLWTCADLEARPNDVASAISTVIGIDVATLIDRARLWKRAQSNQE